MGGGGQQGNQSLGGFGGGRGYSNGNQPALSGNIGGAAWKTQHPYYQTQGSPGWQAMHPQQQQQQNWWTGGASAQGWNPAGSGSNPPLQGQPDIADFFQHMFGGGGGYGNNYLY